MNILKNRWFKFGLWTLLYLLVFVVWMRNAWMLLGIAVIFDIFITRFISRHVLVYHRRARESSGAYKTVAEWVEAIVFAVVVASVIHIFVFQMYVIPTPSMEKSLLVGDYLYVSKLTYGPKMPNTPLSMPLVHNTMPGFLTFRSRLFSLQEQEPAIGAKSYSEAIKLPYKRLAGLKKIKRDDVVVFNFPAGDTVILENPGVTYYDVLRDFQTQRGAKEGRIMLQSRYTVVSRPVDKRENYVKRCVGLPGDTIRIAASRLYVNGTAQKEIPGMQQMYHVRTSGPIPQTVLRDMGIAQSDIYYNQPTGEYLMPLTAANLDKVRAMADVLGVEQFSRGSGLEIFPNNYGFDWTESDFGPLWIPSKGATVALTLENLPLYERIIDVFEENDLAVREGVIYINGVPATSYTFKMDYYWMMGDNRQNSLDSRFWGFVPEDHIVGKASFVWLSLDAERGWFDGKVRWNKMFRKIR
jgi:signal peptidase I